VAPASAAPASAAAFTPSSDTGTINVLLVANDDQQTMTKQMFPDFQKRYPNITVNFTVLPENDERAKMTTDLATGAGQFDVVAEGLYNTPLDAKQGWLLDLQPSLSADTAYNLNDVSAGIRAALSYNGDLYAAPIGADLEVTMYRKDLLAAAGVTMPLSPTWTDIDTISQKLLSTLPKGVYPDCLRALPGWGQMGAELNTVVNTFGGRWFDANWNAQVTSPATSAAIKFYLNEVRKYDAPGSTQSGNNECGTQFATGKAAIFIDDSGWGDYMLDPANNPQAANLGFAYAPVGPADVGKSVGHGAWLWSWAYGVEKTSKNQTAALDFIKWATGPDYVADAIPVVGFGHIPPLVRASALALPAYQTYAKDLIPILSGTMAGLDPAHPTVFSDTPYVGSTYPEIPEWSDIGDKCTQEFAAAIAGSETDDQAIANCQQVAQSAVDAAGYHK